MIDEANTVESEEQLRTIGLMTFLNQISLFLLGPSFLFRWGEEKIVYDLVSWKP